MRRSCLLLLALLLGTLSASEWTAAPLAEDGQAAPAGTITPAGDGLLLAGGAGWGAVRDLPVGDATVVLRISALDGTLLVQAVAEGSMPTLFAATQRKDGTAKEQRAPQFVRLAVQGRQASYWISQDGVRWLNRGGGFRLAGEAPIRLRLGLGKGAAQSARVEATVTEGLRLENRTDWFGNSLPGSVGDTVNLNMTSLAVAADGSCLVTSNFEEQGHCTAIFRDGRQMAPKGKSMVSGRAAAFAGDIAFVAAEGGVQRLDRDLRAQGKAALVKGKEAGRGITGLAADDAEVFASLPDEGAIVVLAAAGMQERRRLPVADAGRLAIGPDGALWATVELYDSIYAIPYPRPGYVVRLDRTSGRELARITDLAVPSAICFDAKGRLLVAENGLDQQVRIYDVSAEPRLVGTAGRKGGMQASRGAVEDHVFNGITGIGCDAAGSLYVAQTGWPLRYAMGGMMGNATRLISLPASSLDGKTEPARWKLESQSYIFDGATLDPADPTSAYGGADQRYRLDWTKRGRIGEWAGFLIDFAAHDDEGLTRRIRSTPFLRRIDGERFLYLVGDPGLVVYRFAAGSEFAIPCAALCESEDGKVQAWPQGHPTTRGAPWVWSDLDGDGHGTAGEYTVGEAGVQAIGSRWMPDARGDVWQTSWGQNLVQRWRMSGLVDGRPRFERAEAITGLAPFSRVEWAHYEPATDTMVLAGGNADYEGTDDLRVQTTLVAVYTAWSTPARKLDRWFPFHDGDNSFQDPAMGFAVCGDFAYIGSRPGNVHVYDLRHGNRVTELTAGPTVYGAAGYFDRDQSSVQAFLLPGGEQVALCQENGYGRVLAYRWRPDDRPAAPPASPPRLRLASSSRGAMLRWIAPASGLIRGYRIERAEAEGGPWTAVADLAAFTEHTDAAAPRGRRLWYRVAAVNAAGVGAWSQPVGMIVTQPTAAFVGEDKDVQGDWRGKYGSLAYYIDGDASAANPLSPAWLRFDGGTLRKRAGHPSSEAKEPWYPLVADPAVAKRTGPFAGSGYQLKEQSYVVELVDGKTRALTLYFAGHPNGHGETVEILDPDSGAVLDRRATAAKGPGQGRHLTWNVAGRFAVRITKDAKAFACPLAAIFFDPQR